MPELKIAWIYQYDDTKIILKWEKLLAAPSNRNDNGKGQSNDNETEIRRKTTGHFKKQTGKFWHEKAWTWLRKRNLMWNCIVTKINAIRTNYIKAKIDDLLRNNKSELRIDEEKSIKYKIFKGSKQAKNECKT